jgi:MscS family membrane protein
MRSTRFRTVERTVMTVPNGQLATMTLDNVTKRDLVWFRHVLGIRMDTGNGRLEQLLTALRELLANDPFVDPFRRRVSLTRLDAQSLDVELNCYVRVVDMEAFLPVQEGLLLKSLRILDAHEAVLAAPLRGVVLARGEDPAEESRDVSRPQPSRPLP